MAHECCNEFERADLLPFNFRSNLLKKHTTNVRSIQKLYKYCKCVTKIYVSVERKPFSKNIITYLCGRISCLTMANKRFYKGGYDSVTCNIQMFGVKSGK